MGNCSWYDYCTKEENRYFKNGEQLINIERVIQCRVNGICELSPNDSHKSFYGKARVIYAENGIYLMSYNTIVCAFITENKDFRFVRF